MTNSKPSRPQNNAAQILAQIRTVTTALEALGITVRREALRRGHGFRVRSGSCRLYSDKVLLIDSTLPPHEQLALLQTFLADIEQQRAA